jgi:uncharacterized protein (TIRG00374 family)
MEHQNRPRNRLVTVIIIVITLVGVVLIAFDWKNMRSVLAQTDWHYLPAALLFTFFSYLPYSYAYAIVSQMMGIRMGKRELTEVCFMSTIVNHVLTSGGVAGYSLRYLLMKMYGVSLKDVLASSLLHYFLTSLYMLTFLPLTFIYLLLHVQVPRGIAIALGIMTLLFGLILILITGLLLFPSRRGPIINLLARLGQAFLRRDLKPWLIQLDEALTRGTQEIRRRPMKLVWILLLTLVDFICSIAAMGFCFNAMGLPVRAGVLLTGYVIGIMAGLLSMVPGGFGVQEGSMAGIFVLLGIQFEQAILATILFRFIYYLLPYFLILLIYNRLLRQARQQELTER